MEISEVLVLRVSLFVIPFTVISYFCIKPTKQKTTATRTEIFFLSLGFLKVLIQRDTLRSVRVLFESYHFFGFIKV